MAPMEMPVDSYARHRSCWICSFAELTRLGVVSLFLLLLVTAHASHAQPPQVAESPQLQKCLKRADELPDIAAFEAEAWIKKNGGDDAHLCRAFAQANRGMHLNAAREFWALASSYEKKSPQQDLNRALLMHNLSGQEFFRAKDIKNSEAQYMASLKIAPDNASALIGRAETRIKLERYWDALDDLNRVLKKTPDDVFALRQRGRVWMELGNENNAQEDFGRASVLAGDKAGD